MCVISYISTVYHIRCATDFVKKEGVKISFEVRGRNYDQN